MELNPYSAEYVVVCSLNSWIASTDRTAAGVPIDVSMLAVPSIMKLFDVGRRAHDADGVADALPHAALFACRFHRAGAEEQQLQEVAAVERQLGDLLLGNGVSDRGAAGVEHERVRLDFDASRRRCRREHHVDTLDLVDRERHIRVDRRS